MRAKLITTILLILCGLGIGLLAFENLMWAVWGKQNRWFEYVGFWGCALMLVSGLVALKSLRLGTFLGCVGFILMLFYLGPAVANTIHEIAVGKLDLKAEGTAQFVFIVGIAIITLVRLIWNVKRVSCVRS
jgi:hypothetical protein